MNVATLHLSATIAMAGVILFVQIVHYPLMSLVGDEEFVRYEQSHTRRTGWVVVPLMCVELTTAVWLLLVAPDRLLATVGVALLAVIWGSTFLVQAPTHTTLLRGFDRLVHRRLVASNWIRTIAWLARVPVAIGLML